MQSEPPVGFAEVEEHHGGADFEARIRELLVEQDRLLTPEQRERLEKRAAAAARAALEKKVEVNGVLMTRREWKRFMDECPHEHFEHPGVTLMDGSRMSICKRCKQIQHEAIAKMIEKGDFDD